SEAASWSTQPATSAPSVIDSAPDRPQSKRTWYGGWVGMRIRVSASLASIRPLRGLLNPQRFAQPTDARVPQACDSPAAVQCSGTAQGLSSRSVAGSTSCGACWYATGRRQRPIAAVPTAVLESFVVAGQGPQ